MTGVRDGQQQRPALGLGGELEAQPSRAERLGEAEAEAEAARRSQDATAGRKRVVADESDPGLGEDVRGRAVAGVPVALDAVAEARLETPRASNLVPT